MSFKKGTVEDFLVILRVTPGLKGKEFAFHSLADLSSAAKYFISDVWCVKMSSATPPKSREKRKAKEMQSVTSPESNFQNDTPTF